MSHAPVLTSLRRSLMLSKTGKTQHHLLQQLWLPCSMLPRHDGTFVRTVAAAGCREVCTWLCSCSLPLTHNGIQSHRAFYLLIRPQRGCYRSWICKTCSTSNAQGNKMRLQTIVPGAS